VKYHTLSFVNELLESRKLFNLAENIIIWFLCQISLFKGRGYWQYTANKIGVISRINGFYSQSELKIVS
jgi:hypothetical protein